jgi:hypothetical protein
MENLLTVGSIAKLADVELHRAEHLIRSRHIQPTARAGALRVFDQATADRLVAELRQAKSVREAKAVVAIQPTV